MPTLWFCIIATLLAIYAMLDGFDIGAGIVHLIVARSDVERRAVLRSIGPVWDGNEVWLIASGTALFLAFPVLFAVSFSGFYLPLMIVLWFLIMRGIAIEFRSHIDSPVWTPFWDVVFAGASAALAIFYGVAIGNVIRGVNLDSSGYFFLPLWTNLRVGPQVGILDWFTIMVGLATLVAMAEHGALWIAMKTDGELASRCRRMARIGWWLVALFTALIAMLGPVVQPHLPAAVLDHPWGLVFPVAAIAGLAGIRYFNNPISVGRAFTSSCIYVAGIAASIAFGLFPYVLPARAGGSSGLTIYNAAAPPNSLRIGLAWFIPGIILALVYVYIAYKSFSGKVSADESYAASPNVALR